MPDSSYLVDLTVRLMDGVTRLPAETRARHAAYVLRCQNADGGFSGRDGDSDLYYTGFALRGLAVLDALTPAVCQRAAGFLRDRLTGQATIVDFFSLLYSCFLVGMAGEDVLAQSPANWRERVAETLEAFRVADGGYAKSPGANSSSVYHTFLVALSYQLLDYPLPRPEEVVQFMGSRHRRDGGFVEIAPMRRSGTNPTAAAIGTLQTLATPAANALLDTVREETVHLLLSMASPEGGLRGNAGAPVADLLSTFTGFWTLWQLSAFQRADQEAGLRFVLGVEQAEGGFRGGLWDEQTDVEYTFYGLGCLALLGTTGTEA